MQLWMIIHASDKPCWTTPSRRQILLPAASCVCNAFNASMLARKSSIPKWDICSATACKVLKASLYFVALSWCAHWCSSKQLVPVQPNVHQDFQWKDWEPYGIPCSAWFSTCQLIKPHHIGFLQHDSCWQQYACRAVSLKWKIYMCNYWQQVLFQLGQFLPLILPFSNMNTSACSALSSSFFICD